MRRSDPALPERHHGIKIKAYALSGYSGIKRRPIKFGELPCAALLVPRKYPTPQNSVVIAASIFGKLFRRIRLPRPHPSRRRAFPARPALPPSLTAHAFASTAASASKHLLRGPLPPPHNKYFPRSLRNRLPTAHRATQRLSPKNIHRRRAYPHPPSPRHRTVNCQPSRCRPKKRMRQITHRQARRILLSRRRKTSTPPLSPPQSPPQSPLRSPPRSLPRRHRRKPSSRLPCSYWRSAAADGGGRNRRRCRPARPRLNRYRLRQPQLPPKPCPRWCLRPNPRRGLRLSPRQRTARRPKPGSPTPSRRRKRKLPRRKLPRKAKTPRRQKKPKKPRPQPSRPPGKKRRLKKQPPTPAPNRQHKLPRRRRRNRPHPRTGNPRCAPTWTPVPANPSCCVFPATRRRAGNTARATGGNRKNVRFPQTTRASAADCQSCPAPPGILSFKAHNFST